MSRKSARARERERERPHACLSKATYIHIHTNTHTHTHTHTMVYVYMRVYVYTHTPGLSKAIHTHTHRHTPHACLPEAILHKKVVHLSSFDHCLLEKKTLKKTKAIHLSVWLKVDSWIIDTFPPDICRCEICAET
jgi:hypothetical protein